MGNVESRFRESVEAGDHKKAYELYYNKKALRDSIDPKEKCYPDGSSLLHQTARHAMQPLYETFLEHPNSNPLELTDCGKSCIHLICSSRNDSAIRERMLSLTIEHPNVTSQESEYISQGDKDGNTPLHYACAAGLEQCVMRMLGAGANPGLSNKDGKSPIDMAADNNHDQLAKQLETHVVFAENNEGVVVEMDPILTEEPSTIGVAMKDQEIQSMKDALIIETSELLGWSKEVLLNSWMSDPQATCEKAGVDLPATLSAENMDDQLLLRQKSTISNPGDEVDCSICYSGPVHNVKTPCGHAFCVDCWRQYLHDKIANGKVGEVPCPGYACYKLVPNHVIEKLVSREMARKYLQYDIKEFVDTNPGIRWCPHPGCGQAVKKPVDPGRLDEVTTLDEPSDSRENQPNCLFVHCGKDHYFCWSCGEIGHAPSSCKEWKDWLNKVKELSGKLGSMSSEEVADAASSQWVTSNSKPCPNCSAPIEKTTGCNHMKCFKCKHDFCWMCLDRWSKHSSATGGYFECNRYKQIKKVDEMIDKKLQNEDYQLISHFKHYHERYCNHIHSLKIESEYLYSADTKMAELQRLAGLSVEGGVQFVKDAVRQLVEARHTLIASYGYAYFLMVKREKEEFERMQGDLEENVEALAEVVAKPHLRKSKSEIIQLTNSVKEKRLAFISRVENGQLTSNVQSLATQMQRTIVSEQILKAESDRQQRLEEERQIRQAMRESTRHFQSEALLNSDTELAILLSMQGHDKPEEDRRVQSNRPWYSSEEGHHHLSSDLLNSTPALVDYDPSTTPERPLFQSPSQNTQTSGEDDFDLIKWRQSLLDGPSRWSSSSSSSSGSLSPPTDVPSLPPSIQALRHTTTSTTNTDTAVQQPTSLEDEELQMAIALSLSVAEGGGTGEETHATQTTTPFNAFNNLNIEDQRGSGSSSQRHPLLLNLLDSTARSATDV